MRQVRDGRPQAPQVSAKQRSAVSFIPLTQLTLILPREPMATLQASLVTMKTSKNTNSPRVLRTCSQTKKERKRTRSMRTNRSMSVVAGDLSAAVVAEAFPRRHSLMDPLYHLQPPRRHSPMDPLYHFRRRAISFSALAVLLNTIFGNSIKN